MDTEEGNLGEKQQIIHLLWFGVMGVSIGQIGIPSKRFAKVQTDLSFSV
jgi:hypothetical protein